MASNEIVWSHFESAMSIYCERKSNPQLFEYSLSFKICQVFCCNFVSWYIWNGLCAVLCQGSCVKGRMSRVVCQGSSVKKPTDKIRTALLTVLPNWHWQQHVDSKITLLTVVSDSEYDAKLEEQHTVFNTNGFKGTVLEDEKLSLTVSFIEGD